MENEPPAALTIAASRNRAYVFHSDTPGAAQDFSEEEIMKTCLLASVTLAATAVAVPAGACIPQLPEGATKFLHSLHCGSGTDTVNLGLFATADENLFMTRTNAFSNSSEVVRWRATENDQRVSLDRLDGPERLELDPLVVHPVPGHFWNDETAGILWLGNNRGTPLACRVVYYRGC